MISCDTNILFATLDSRSKHHEAATVFLKSWMESDRFGLCELVLLELYVLLRNPAVTTQPYSAPVAVEVIRRFRSHPRWSVFDYPGPQAGIMNQLWTQASVASFPYKKVFDTRLALTLRHHGVTDFATRNVKDFQGFGFKKVWDPLA
jgi:toxin-antitoxin system PIN domain toxin